MAEIVLDEIENVADTPHAKINRNAKEAAEPRSILS